MLWPNGTTTRPEITSPFGWRVHPVTGLRSLHAGVDFIGYQLVRSIASGRVVAVGTPRGWEGGGIQVWVQHDGALSRSMHLKDQALPVRVGDVIPEGSVLGVMGKTGRVTGVHHHLEIVVNGVQVDPVPFITARIGSNAAAGSSTTVGGFLMALSDAQQEQLALDVHNIAAYLYAGGPAVNDGIGDPGTVFGRVMNLERQVLGANGMFPDTNVIARLAKLQEYVYAGGPSVDNGLGATSSVLGLLYQLLGRPVGEIDETEVAAALAPLLTEHLGALPDEQLTALAERIVTIQGERLAGKA